MTADSKKNAPATNPRLLFIVDSDFGALGVVMYFLYRQPLAANTTILMPAKVYELQAQRFPVAVQAYRSLQDILDVVDSEAPDLVFLFSGYLFTLKAPRLLTIEECRKLVGELRRRGRAIATSDPFLGTFCQISKPPVKHLTPGQWAKQTVKFYLAKRSIRKIAELLRDITHVAPVPCPNLNTGNIEYISFYNPAYIREKNQNVSDFTAGQDSSAAGCKQPGWLFVLAAFDLEFQQHKHGERKFVDIIVGKLRETLDNDRQPTLIAPLEFISAVSRHFDTETNLKLIPNCSYQEFEQLLMDAEIAFYWQFFSTSTFLRLFRGLPVFFFDPGHLATINPVFLETGLANYFLGDPPVLLDVEDSLQANRLTGFNEGFILSAQETYQKLSRLPTPTELVEQILQRV